MKRTLLAQTIAVIGIMALVLIVASSCGTPCPTETLVELAIKKTEVAVLQTQVAKQGRCPTEPPTTEPPPTVPPTIPPTLPPTVPPTVPPPASPSTAAGYTSYENLSLGFSAQYPKGWEVEVGDLQNPETGEAIGKVAEFYSPYDPEGSPLQLLDIAVQIIAGIEGIPLQIPTDQEYRQFITDWVTDREQELVTDPTLVTVDGYKAVQVTYTGTDVFEQYSVVGYSTIFFTADRFFVIEGVAAAENEAEMRNMYEHFMSTFHLLPLP